jgi:hypothetical protein
VFTKYEETKGKAQRKAGEKDRRIEREKQYKKEINGRMESGRSPNKVVG